MAISTAPQSSSLDSNSGFYYYKPNVPIAWIGVLSFAVIAVVHVCLFARRQAWHFWCMYIGLFMELGGLTARAISVGNPRNVSAFLIGYLALILAPTFMAAACYATFSRIVWWVTPPENHRFRLLWCPSRLVTPFFILFDLGSFFIQLLGATAVGSAYSNKTLSAEERKNRAESGLGALKLGFALQIICFVLFAVVGVRFLVVSRRWTTRIPHYPAPLGANWTRLTWTTNAAAIAITIRAIYQMAEFVSDGSQDSTGYLLLHEWPFWLFDAAPMLGVFVAFAVVYPGQHLPSEFLGWWLNTRKLRKQAESWPPAYSHATAQCLRREVSANSQ